MFEVAHRLKEIPPYLFAELDRLKQEIQNKGVDVIDLGVGDPDIPTPKPIIEIAKRALEERENHRYPTYKGMLSFRRAVASWYKRRFNVELDAETEILTLIGSKEGIAHLPLAFVNNGDIVLVPSPAYPVYAPATYFAGGTPYTMPLLEENDFLPALGDIPEDILGKTKIMFLNYPNNPTSACATEDFYKDVVSLAKTHNFIVAGDNAYSELYFDNKKPISFLEIEGAKEVGVEFHSLSKTFNMTGWRIGFTVGNSEIIEGLGRVKTNIDSGVFQAVQEAGREALNHEEEITPAIRGIYEERRDLVDEYLKKLGFSYRKPEATFYFWIKVGKDSTSFAKSLLERCGVVVTPGVGFGKEGEGYIRLSITQNKERLKEAMERISYAL
ncbi:MAG: LL-diaminopimelate aminotransferase [Deltaproteobacteria bacterium]|nr:LL-diaminopimelate aminotransferase [Deltaproteobacteria bacterium]